MDRLFFMDTVNISHLSPRPSIASLAAPAATALVNGPSLSASMDRDGMSFRETVAPDAPHDPLRRVQGAGITVAGEIARLACDTLSVVGRLHEGRVLLVEPFSASVAEALRQLGFAGTIHAIMRRADTTPQRWHANPFDHLSVVDWLDLLGADGSDAVVTDAAGRIDGTYDVVITCDFARLLPSGAIVAAATWAATFVEPFGHLICGEPASCDLLNAETGLQQDVDACKTLPVPIESITAGLMAQGLVLARDVTRVEVDWTWSIACYQLRPGDSSRLAGALTRVTRTRLATDTALQEGIVAAYREVFGGPEWREWARCTRPGCGRRYSHAEYMRLQPPGTCLCDWSEPLVPFYDSSDILAKLAGELGDDARSRCYVKSVQSDAASEGLEWLVAHPFSDSAGVPAPDLTVERQGHTRRVVAAAAPAAANVSEHAPGRSQLTVRVDAFIWGYLDRLDLLTAVLLPDMDASVTDRFRAGVRQLIARAEGTSRPAAEHTLPAPRAEQQIYYQSEIGVIETARNFSLLRTMFSRMCQFAREQGALVVLTRTSRRSSAYALLRGIGFDIVHDYREHPRQTDTVALPTDLRVGDDGGTAVATVREAGDGGQDDPPSDERVVLGGVLADVLALLVVESDRRIQHRIAQRMRQEQQAQKGQQEREAM